MVPHVFTHLSSTQLYKVTLLQFLFLFKDEKMEAQRCCMNLQGSPAGTCTGGDSTKVFGESSLLTLH